MGLPALNVKMIPTWLNKVMEAVYAILDTISWHLNVLHVIQPADNAIMKIKKESVTNAMISI